ncbi:uncharacterized protein N7484_002687 [Penicillium longicatenatum]|uniref:uncharacterized protein n=1 Tax=Penicillium longicatenatum TaxID=1561947 RepID=UPI002547C65F|nr:uncharacterized protein N7484_002687 [Penicillium longicatenatum]KAJ5648964.1 hypothetical protein N7484_002687 [Penicillium longicatenatum]
MPKPYASSLPDPAASVRESHGTSEATRMKVRKGTRSCWECRRRKMKCIFSSPADKACFRCHRRGVKCVGQEYPEEITPSLERNIQMADRIMRVEALVEQLLKKVPNDSPPATVQEARNYDVGTIHHGISAPSLVSSEPSQGLALSKPLAIHLHPDFYEEMKGLSVPPREMMRRLADTAINILMTNDNIIDCIEGLDCLMIESWYHANGGDLWKGLVTIRRAMTLAQLMGFYRPGRAQCKVVEHNTEAYPELVWFRIVSIERYLCLMLDVPQGTQDRTMASESMLASDTPMGRLDRIHCVIASRILERNQTDPDSHDIALTQGLDEELQNASGGLSPRWWLTPNLATAMSQPEALFWDMRRLFHQLYHYSLLIQLHLPYMLRSSVIGEIYDYSRSTCINASREILSRFVMFHSFNRIAFCSHIDEHRRRPPSVTRPQRFRNHRVSRGNLLAHQRPCDHALIEKVLESIEEVSRLDGDAMSVHSSSLLRRLMAIEAEAADETLHHDGVQVPVAEQEPHPSDSSDTVRMSIPYFGFIKITRKGISLDAAETSQTQYQITEGFSANGDDLQAAAFSSGSGMSSMNPNAGGKTPAYSTPNYHEGFPTEREAQSPETSAHWVTINHNDPAAHDSLQFRTEIPAAVPQQYEEPLYTAGYDNWALQDADTGFFDNLMEITGNDGDDGNVFSAWPN